MTGEANPPKTEAAAQAREALHRIAAEHRKRLARTFYDALLQDAAAAAFLDHAVVADRLARSLEKWLLDLFQDCGERTAEGDQSIAVADDQRRIGEVHARVRVSMALVMRGAGLLKREMSALILASDLDEAARVAALIQLNERMDWAISLMSEAYMQGSLRRAQMDEAFRLFAVGQDVTLERESQHSALLDWLQGVLFRLFEAASAEPLAPIANSPFGLWFRHRAGLIFQGMPSLDAIDRNLKRIDGDLLPAIQQARERSDGGLSAELAKLKGAVGEIKFLLNDLFHSVAGIENGRDPLTRLLNRRFLPTILGRETMIAGQTDMPLTLLLLDLDWFKAINDEWGHAGGDFVLQRVAEAVMDSVRLNDFVFRYGGEEFLITLVETDAEGAVEVADRIRQRLAALTLRLPNGGMPRVTASIGVATYGGHPDFNLMIEAADRALYEAKRLGRNRTVLSRERAIEAAS